MRSLFMAFDLRNPLKLGGRPEKKPEKREGERRDARDERREGREERQQELDARPMIGVVVALDTYEDIFSDFDTRPFSERGLSEDFLRELSQRTLETPKGELEVQLVLPKALRKEKEEQTIKSRLRKHFSQELKRIEQQRDSKRMHGYRYFALGAVMLLLEAYLVEQSENLSKLLFALAQAIVLPAGWFFAYTGLEKVLQPYGEDSAAYSFAKKLQGASYKFISYEELEEDARRELERLEKVVKEAREKAEAISTQASVKMDEARPEEKRGEKKEEGKESKQ